MGHKIELKDAFKKVTLDQDKIRTPEDTVKNFKERIKKVNLNILKEAKRIDNGRLDIPVFFSVCGEDAKAVTGTNKQMGKGATLAQAEASAVMELAERFSFFSFCKNEDNFFTDTYKNVGEEKMPLELIAASVHDDSKDLEITKKIFETLPLKWTKSYNLTKEKEVLVPFDWFFMINEFNGPSAGNCTEEAISQGICEIIERHVSSIIAHKKLNVPAINPASADDKMVVEMFDKYTKAGINLYISDFSLDTGVPTVGVMAYDPATFPEKSEIVWTAGTTPDPQKALSRALTETAQLAGDFNSGSNYVASGLPKYTSLDECGFIMNPEKTIGISDLPNLSDNNIRVEVENLIGALKKNNMEVHLINTMHKDLQIPAFYTIVPGAHFRERSLGTSLGMFSTKFIAENYSPMEAIMRLTEIESMLPDKFYVKFFLGISHLSIEDPETALSYFKKALENDPVHEEIVSIYSYMGVCLKDMGKYNEALDALKKGEQYDTERTDIYNLMGFCHFMLKEHEKAIENFKKVIQLDPSSAIDYANIASNYRDMGEKAKAIEYYVLALNIDPTIEFARDNLIKLQS